MNKLIYKDWTFEDDQVKSGSCYLETSLPSSSLGINTLESVVKCDDPSIADFAQNDPVTYFYKGNQRGIYYIQSVDRIGPDRYTLTAVSALGLLAQKRHPGGIYTGQTVQEVVTDICGDIPVIIKSNLSNIALYGWLPYVAPPKSSAKDNLSQVLFAIGAAVTNDLNGVLRIEPLWSGVSGVLDDDHVCQGGKVTTEPVVTAVSVTEHQYFQGGETKELFNGSTQAGDIITFDEPAYDLTADGFDILESGANYAKVSAGSGKLTGRAYIHNTRQVTVEVTPGPVENIKTPTGNPTLVSLVNSYAVAQRLAAYYKCRETIKAPALIGGNRPGAVVSMYHPYDKKMVSACLAVTDAHMSSVIKADLEALVGYEPPNIAQQEYYDNRVVIDADSEFVVSEGVTNIRAVIIGAGSGGQAGSDGENGTSGGDAYVSAGRETESFGTAGVGGKGGVAGIGGAPGKISVIDLVVKEGDVLSAKTGIGGKGGTENGSPGESGTETTVDLNGEVFSSADGSTSPTGYIDTVTGDVYAETGISGVNGGNGGNSLKQDTPAEDGDPVGENSGGIAGTNSISSSSNSKVVFDSYKTSKTTKTSTTSAGWTEGYSSYKQDAEGRLSAAGSLTYAGTKNGVFKSGPVYYDFTNSPAPSYAGSVNSSMNSRSASGSSSSWTETTITQTNSRKYVKKTMQVSKGTLASGGGGAAFGANGDGITGAAAVSPESPTRLGCGGNGGHGGGGGGGGGAGYVSTSGDTSDFTTSYNANGLSGGSAGKGSAGSDGANGGVILYFGSPKIVKSGSVMEKTGRFVLDRTGRLIVV